MQIGSFQDADFAGDLRNWVECYASSEAEHSYQLVGLATKQKAVLHSSTEAEIISFDAGP